jgi:hypothetical protein
MSRVQICALFEPFGKVESVEIVPIDAEGKIVVSVFFRERIAPNLMIQIQAELKDLRIQWDTDQKKFIAERERLKALERERLKEAELKREREREREKLDYPRETENLNSYRKPDSLHLIQKQRDYREPRDVDYYSRAYRDETFRKGCDSHRDTYPKRRYRDESREYSRDRDYRDESRQYFTDRDYPHEGRRANAERTSLSHRRQDYKDQDTNEARRSSSNREHGNVSAYSTSHKEGHYSTRNANYHKNSTYTSHFDVQSHSSSHFDSAQSQSPVALNSTPSSFPIQQVKAFDSNQILKNLLFSHEEYSRLALEVSDQVNRCKVMEEISPKKDSPELIIPKKAKKLKAIQKLETELELPFTDTPTLSDSSSFLLDSASSSSSRTIPLAKAVDRFWKASHKTKHNQTPSSLFPTSKRDQRAQARKHKSFFYDSSSPHSSLVMRTKALKLTKSSIHAFGIFAMEPIDKGEFVIEYVGEVIRDTIANLREKYIYSRTHAQSSYLFRIDKETVIDATLQGNLARFMNHSCDATCVAKVLQIEGRKRICVYAKRALAPGDEITYDYKFPIEDEKIPCLCGASNCRGSLN